jgi:hypothetical protein
MYAQEKGFGLNEADMPWDNFDQDNETERDK